jgi:GNAT superfamily N-acetyltransferase
LIEKELPGGVTIKERADEKGFDAFDKDGNRIGRLDDNLTREQMQRLGGEYPANVSSVLVQKEYRGKGVGRALYEAFAEKHEGNIAPSGHTTREAWKVWKRNYPEKVDAFVKEAVAQIKNGAEPSHVIGNITDTEVAQRVAEAVAKKK